MNFINFINFILTRKYYGLPCTQSLTIWPNLSFVISTLQSGFRTLRDALQCEGNTHWGADDWGADGWHGVREFVKNSAASAAPQDSVEFQGHDQIG